MYGVPSISNSWKGVSVFIATDYGIQMAEDMMNFTEAKYKGKRGDKQRHFKQDLRKNVTVNYDAWKAFVADPVHYAARELPGYANWTVKTGRRQLADSDFLPEHTESTLLTPAEIFTLHERDLLFHQHSFVHVTANPNVLSPSDARLHLSEEWRFRMAVLEGGVYIQQPVDFGAYICHNCRQFAKYGFCEHCIIVGTMQRIGVSTIY
jgi:hypothetical protein